MVSASVGSMMLEIQLWLAPNDAMSVVLRSARSSAPFSLAPTLV